MRKNLRNKKAFSLIELSIVILIIGVIVAGVTQSSRMIGAFRLSTARNLTQSSPVASMKNLTMWLETTATASFADSESDNGLTVTQWNDINPTSTYKYTTTGGPGATYTTNCMNSLPCLRFNGSSTYFTYDGSFFVGTDYTVFVVEQRRAGPNNINYFMGGTNAALNTNLQFGYYNNTTLIFAQWNNDSSYTIAGYSSPIPRIHAYKYSSTTGKNIYLNGSDLVMAGASSQTAPLVSYPGSMIGRYYENLTTYRFYNGDICEIIAFSRALTTEERDAIEVYLGKKWGITVI